MNIDDLDDNLDDGFIEIDISEDEDIIDENKQEFTNPTPLKPEVKPAGAPMPNPTPKKQLGLGWKILIGILTTFILVIVVAGVFLFSKLNKINRAEQVEFIAVEEEDFEVDEEEDLSGLKEFKPEEITWAATEEVTGEDDIVNILLIGQDRRKGQGRTRSDTMIIATLNKTDKTIKLTSLMRDLYVQIPGYSDNRMNAAYAFGGMELLDATVKQNFGIEIDGNIEVDFTGFSKVIDLVGGVNIDITDAELYYLNSYIKDNCKNLGLVPDSYYINTAGYQHLNGVQALAYSRIRYVGHGDFGRTERQRKVLMSAFEGVMDLSLTEMLTLADQVLPLVTTDMSNMELITLATDAFQLNIGQIETHNIPQDASYQSASIRGMSVLVPNIDECRRVLKEIIYE